MRMPRYYYTLVTFWYSSLKRSTVEPFALPFCGFWGQKNATGYKCVVLELVALKGCKNFQPQLLTPLGTCPSWGFFSSTPSFYMGVPPPLESTAAENDLTRKTMIDIGYKFVMILSIYLPWGKIDNWLFARWSDVSDFSWPMAGGRFLRKLLQTFNFSSDKTFPIPRKNWDTKNQKS